MSVLLEYGVRIVQRGFPDQSIMLLIPSCSIRKLTIAAATKYNNVIHRLSLYPTYSRLFHTPNLSSFPSIRIDFKLTPGYHPQ